MAVKRQSIGAYGGANVSQMTAKSRSKRRQTAVSRLANGSQSALTGVQMSVRRQRNRTQNVVKRRQMAVKRQSIGAYGQANVSQTAAKSHSSRRMIFPPLLWGDQGASQNHRPPKRGNFNRRPLSCGTRPDVFPTGVGVYRIYPCVIHSAYQLSRFPAGKDGVVSSRYAMSVD